MKRQHRTQWVWIVCGLLLTLALAGCVSSGGDGDDNGGGEVGTNPDNGGAVTFDVSGSWEGTWQSSLVPSGGILLAALTQDGEELTGEVDVTGSPCLTRESTVGSLIDDSVVLGISRGFTSVTEFSDYASDRQGQLQKRPLFTNCRVYIIDPARNEIWCFILLASPEYFENNLSRFLAMIYSIDFGA